MKFKEFSIKILFKHNFVHRFHSKKIVLGIETSCDDTGAAIVEENGTILGEECKSQMKIHLENGGVIPHLAAYFHQENIKNVVSTVLDKSKVSMHDISAIAVTTRPGLGASLLVGIQHAKKLAQQYSKSVIPVHHMEAHALTPRLQHNIPFPFLALLASGGHCQIALAKNVNEFHLLGNSCHNSPGEVLDKIARRLKLQNLPSCSEMSGGQAIEFMSEGGDPTSYNFPHSLVHRRDCDFSFSGYIAYATEVIEEEEKQYDVPADGVIPNVRDFCASLLHGYALHMVHRIHRAFAFCEEKNLMKAEQRTLVFSGGVACNSYIRASLEQACLELKSKYFPAPKKLCNDNGVMIAWNGIEKLRENIDILSCTENISPQPNSPLGIDISEDVKKASIKMRIPKINIAYVRESMQLKNR